MLDLLKAWSSAHFSSHFIFFYWMNSFILGIFFNFRHGQLSKVLSLLLTWVAAKTWKYLWGSPVGICRGTSNFMCSKLSFHMSSPKPGTPGFIWINNVIICISMLVPEKWNLAGTALSRLPPSLVLFLFQVSQNLDLSTFSSATILASSHHFCLDYGNVL